MSKERIARLEEWIKEDPTDPFNKYGLALELQWINRERANEIFIELLTQHADYLPTYYAAAKFYEDEDEAQAVQILEKGISLAELQDDVKTKRELQSLLNQILS